MYKYLVFFSLLFFTACEQPTQIGTLNSPLVVEEDTPISSEIARINSSQASTLIRASYLTFTPTKSGKYEFRVTNADTRTNTVLKLYKNSDFETNEIVGSPVYLDQGNFVNTMLYLEVNTSYYIYIGDSYTRNATSNVNYSSGFSLYIDSSSAHEGDLNDGNATNPIVLDINTTSLRHLADDDLDTTGVTTGYYTFLTALTQHTYKIDISQDNNFSGTLELTLYNDNNFSDSNETTQNNQLNISALNTNTSYSIKVKNVSSVGKVDYNITVSTP